MSDHFHDPLRPKARKDHRCILCYGPIYAGELYVVQTGYYEGRAFRNKFHAECFDGFIDEGDGEFTPGQYPWPESVQAEFNRRQEAQKS